MRVVRTRADTRTRRPNMSEGASMAQDRSGAKRHQYRVAGRTGNTADAPKTKGEVKRERKALLSKTAKYVLVAIGVLAMVLSVSTMACAGVLNQSQGDVEYKLTGGIAATVEGADIAEDSITRQIMSSRTSMGYDSDEDWAQYLVDSGYTPESYRQDIIDSYVRQYLLGKAEQDYDVTVTQEDLDQAWDELVAGYSSEDELVETLESMGMSKDSYLTSLESSLAQEKLRDKVAPVEEPSDDDVIAYANENLSGYNDARRSSHILIKVADDATDEEREEARAEAQEILDKLNAGEIEFADAAKEYSDDSSADDGGDVGWDKLTTFVTAYQDALSQLSPGQISGVVESDYGFHIIQCTDLFHVDGEVTSIDQIPEDLREQFIETITSTEQTTAYNEWLDQYVEDADVTVNPMPEDVPYNVSLEGVVPTSEQTTDGTATE